MWNSPIPAFRARPTVQILLVLGLATLGFAACAPEAERPAEETEEEVDQAGGGLEEAGRRAGENLDEAGRRVGEELEQAGEALERGADRAGEELEPAARDARITATVKSKLLSDPEVSAFRIDVDTSDGRVTLSGTVESETAKEEAEELARNTEGVEEVENLIEVAPEDG